MTPGPAALNVAGSIFGAIGAYEQGKSDAADYRYRAKKAQKAAAETIRAARYDSWRMNLGMRQATGEAANKFARAGVEMSGTAIDDLVAIAQNMTLDKLMMGRAARIAARQHLEDAKMYKKAAKSAKKSGVLNAIGSFL